MRTFDVKQAPEIQEYLRKGLDKAVRRGLLATAIKIVGDIQAVIIPSYDNPPVDRRVYAAGFRPRITEDGAEIINTTPYAPIIEFGARAKNVKPGRAMINALTEWANRKGLSREGGGKNGIAWAIAQSMKKRGIFNISQEPRGGLRVLEKALQRALNMKTIEREVRREVEREWK